MNSNTRSNRTRWLLFGFFLLLGLLFATALPNFIRDAIILPIYSLFWLMGLFIRSLDQEVIWGSLLVGAVLVTGRLLISRPRSRRVSDTIEEPREPQSRIAQWNAYVRLMRSNTFGEVYFVDETRRLFLEIMAYRHHISKAEAEEQIRSRQIQVPDPIYEDYFKHRKPEPEGSGIFSRLRIWFDAVFKGRPDLHQVNREQKIQDIIRYLSDLMADDQRSSQEDP